MHVYVVIYSYVWLCLWIYLQPKPQCTKYNTIFPFHYSKYLGIYVFLYIFYYKGLLQYKFSDYIGILHFGVHVCTCFRRCGWYNYYCILSISNFKRSLHVCKLTSCFTLKKTHIYLYKTDPEIFWTPILVTLHCAWSTNSLALYQSATAV